MPRMTRRNHHSPETSSSQSVRSRMMPASTMVRGEASSGRRARRANQTVVSAGTTRAVDAGSPVVRIGVRARSPAATVDGLAGPALQATTTAPAAEDHGRRASSTSSASSAASMARRAAISRRYSSSIDAVVAVLAFGGVATPVGGLRQPGRRRGARRREAVGAGRVRRPRHRHPAAVAARSARRRCGRTPGPGGPRRAGRAPPAGRAPRPGRGTRHRASPAAARPRPRAPLGAQREVDAALRVAQVVAGPRLGAVPPRRDRAG